MEETGNSSDQNEGVSKEVPQLLALLKEMKEGLDVVRSKVQALTVKVKENQFPTADGISYLEAKHLLLLSYCQSIVYYLLRKAKGFSIEGHPVVRSLVEIRLFLEKIWPIDKKQEYQIQKLTKVGDSKEEKVGADKEQAGATHNTDDPLSYRPNPDMILSKTNNDPQVPDGVYRPPKFAPTSMEDEKMSKQEKVALRKEKETLRRTLRSGYTRDLMNELEGKPEEEREVIGAESTEINRFKEQLKERERREEDLFIRAPVTKTEKKMKKRMKTRNGLIGLTEGFYDETKTFAMEEDGGESNMSFGNASRGRKKFNKRKRRH